MKFNSFLDAYRLEVKFSRTPLSQSKPKYYCVIPGTKLKNSDEPIFSGFEGVFGESDHDYLTAQQNLVSKIKGKLMVIHKSHFGAIQVPNIISIKDHQEVPV